MRVFVAECWVFVAECWTLYAIPFLFVHMHSNTHVSGWFYNITVLVTM